MQTSEISLEQPTLAQNLTEHLQIQYPFVQFL